jgi:hypothetical protein
MAAVLEGRQDLKERLGVEQGSTRHQQGERSPRGWAIGMLEFSPVLYLSRFLMESNTSPQMAEMP